ncbi:MAG: hypothetical protein JOY57_13060 [Actinobacteria bacterium]|nr:hypothetical protein [Actinomycetota bacterium]
MLDDERGLRRWRTRVGRHLRWARTEGVAKLAEEDDLNPVTRVADAARRWRWRRQHGVQPGQATPVWLVGVQRSSTNMVVQGLTASPAFEVHNENDRRAFEHFRLRPDPVVRAIILSSRHRYVLFKPLCDSHRVDELLTLGTPMPGRAIWAYRNVDDRVRSALAKFGDNNLQVLRQIADGTGTGRWQAQRVSTANLELIKSFDYDRMTPASAAALFWVMRNSLYFDLGLDRRDDVLLSSYDALVADPAAAMRQLCTFLGMEWDPRLVAHVEERPRVAELEIDPRVRAACRELSERLEAARLVKLPA